MTTRSRAIGRPILKRPEWYDDVPAKVLGVLDHLNHYLAPRECCEACGCLCKPFERCPGCRSAALDAATSSS